MGRTLPDFPWDSLTSHAQTARAHPDGVVDLSVGTPVDDVPTVIQDALAAASNFPGYPTVAGTPALIDAARAWMARRLGVEGTPAVLPTIGSKELIATIGWLLEAPGAVAIPDLAYPTYEVGALLAGCKPVRVAEGELPPPDASLVWVNSPSNPTGGVRTAAELAGVVAWGRANGALVVSDECYVELGWDGPKPVSVLHPSVCGDSHDGVLAIHSLSKRSSFAGYRCGLVAGDSRAVAKLLELRKHAGLIVPGPVQAAAAAALHDDAHVEVQRARYSKRRSLLAAALAVAGFELELSNAGLYLWMTRGESCWESVSWLAERGILVAPGSFYGPAGEHHIRVALTATDERVAAAVKRLTS